MSVWEKLAESLRADPGLHLVNEACPIEVRSELVTNLGSMPEVVSDLLDLLDGAELFVDAMPFVTLLGSGAQRPHKVPDMESYTARWRESRPGCSEWLIGFTCYGGFLVANSKGLVREWDSSKGVWSSGWLSPSQLTNWLLSKGKTYLIED